ncbi:MAG: S41 family peptidase [Cocleimonas sp.]
MSKLNIIILLFLGLILSACGGGSSVEVEPVASDDWASGVFKPDSTFKNKCESPRSDIAGGIQFSDIQGAELDEKNWLRSWTNDVYLWYDEVTDQDPELFNGNVSDYFKTLKTFATTSSGKAKDNFHFIQNTEEFTQESQGGVSFGYGIKFDFKTAVLGRTPRNFAVAYTQPNSSADGEIFRGSKIIEVDGLDFINGVATPVEIAIVNEALFPTIAGISHTFRVLDSGATQSRVITLTSGLVTSVPVQNVKVFDTDSGKVGYFQFNEFIGTAPEQLVDAVITLKNAKVNDLVLDLRYNGGGAVFVAQLLSSMIADTEISKGKVFNRVQFNNKHQAIDPFTRQSLDPNLFTLKVSDYGVDSNETLPNLGLNRVYVLTSSSTCSASELVINSLRGVGVEVILMGDRTCGKPYGFYPTDNCATTYFSIHFSASNAQGFGAYPEGFIPVNSNDVEGIRLSGCAVDDDLNHPLGSIDEAQLSAALNYRSTGNCPTPPVFKQNRSNEKSQSQTILFESIQASQWQNNMIIGQPPKNLFK